MTIPDWIAAEIDAGRSELQSMLDRAPFASAAVRTVAESGDFRIVDGHVERSGDSALSTWFPQHETALVRAEDGTWAMPVEVTEELLGGSVVRVPRAVAAVLGVPRQYQRTLRSERGAHVVHLGDEEVITGPIDRFLTALDARPGDSVEMVFDPAGWFTVRRPTA